MKVAVFHNYLDNIGGAEIVDLMLANELSADIFTTNINKPLIHKMGFSTDRIFSIGRIPVNAPFKQEMAYYRFRKLNLGRKYDLYIIAGDWAMSGAIHNKPNIWYVYSPIREIWDLYQYTRANNVGFFGKIPFDFWVQYHRKNNLCNVKAVDRIFASSKVVQARIKKYLKSDSKVIYPPIDCSKYYWEESKGYYLSVNRLINHKRVDIQLKAFAQMPDKRLVIVGSYEKSRHFLKYKKYIESIKPLNVEILHWVDKDKLLELYAQCKGFITTSHNEDFGLTPIEAMASGKGVIASKEGGYLETVIDGVTGKLIDMNVQNLVHAVNSFCEPDPMVCQRWAIQFDLKEFIQKIRSYIS